MTEMNHHFIIVGAGIIGLTIALTLQENGCQVLLVDKDQVGKGASGGNAGHIATEQVYPIADPSVLKKLPEMLFNPLGPLRLDWRYLPKLTPWALKLLNNMRAKPFEHIHTQLQTLNAAALPAWRQFSDKWHLNQWVKIQGSLLVAEKEATLNTLQTHGKYLNSIAVPNHFLKQDALQEMVPALAENQIGGLFFPDTGHIVNLEKTMTHLSKEFQKLGGEILIHCEVQKIGRSNKDGKPLFILTTPKGALVAEHLVLTTGAFSKPFAKALSGVNVPLETERGYHLMLPHETARLSIPISSADRKFIMTPMEEGLRLAGTVEYGGLKLPPNMKRAFNFIPLANPMLKTPLDNREQTPWMGFRPTISDSLPVIDKNQNCYYAFGHQHLGLTHAALTAHMIKAMHFNEPTPIDRSSFSINRFQ